MKEILYLCGCGCKLKKDKIILFRKTEQGKPTNQNRCALHAAQNKSRITSRFTPCDTCGVEIKFSHRGGSIPTNCKKCQRPIKLQKMRDAAKKRHKKEYVIKNPHLKNGHLADPEKGDCERRGECINEYFDYEAVPCLGCERYWSEFAVEDPRISPAMA